MYMYLLVVDWSNVINSPLSMYCIDGFACFAFLLSSSVNDRQIVLA